MNNARLEELRSKFQENPRRYFAPYANELRKSGDPTQAISVCRTHLATQPGHVSGHIVLGQALYEAGEAAEARDIFTAALDLDPENLIALRTLGEISQVNGEFSSARQWYERLLEADPRNSEVVQLLKDLPTEDRTPAPEPIQAQSAETTLEEHQQDHSPYAPPVAAPSFHSGFTGPGPAYKTADDIAEEERKAQEAAAATEPEAAPESQAMDFVEMDAAPSETESFAQAETSDDWRPAAEQPQDDAIDMVDFDSFAAPTEAMHEASPEAAHEPVGLTLPDESPVAPAEDAPSLEFHLPDSAPSPVEAVAAEPTAAAQIDIPEAESEEVTDHPRVMFAERGFDGPTGDEIGWIMTPSAVESEPESAPEDWFDVPAADAHETAAEPQATEAQPTASAPTQATDAWFDDVPSANVVEPTDGVTSDEFWLPPDLGQIRTTPAAAAESEPEIPVVEASEPEPMPAMSSAEQSFPEPVAEAPAEPVADETIPEPYEAETVAEVDLAQPAESAPIEAELSSAPEAAEPEPEFQAPTSSIEYFDHGAPGEESSYPVEASSHEESYEATPASEWVDPFANRETEPYAEAVPESPAMENGWDAPAIESTPAEEALAAEAYESVESDPLAEPMSVESSEVVSAEAAPSETYAAEAPTYETYAANMAPTEPFSTSPDEWAHAESFSAEMAPPDESKVAEPVVNQSPAPADSSAQPTPAPFITETLAELYLQQGFRDEAVAIYRQLIERDPSNSSLRDRLAAIERRDDDQRASVPQVAADDRSGSQSVRTFFSKIARRPATNPPAASSQADAAQPSDAPFASTASALANLFAASRPTAEDEGAASNLANAYGNPAGRPSRAADRELSLDHLFRDVPPGGSPTGGMSLDEFYSTPNAETGSPTEPGEAGESPESGGADIRQFTAWLEGLRKK